MFQTEFEFTLPCGYLDADGTLHREGLMRRATAADEIHPQRDPRVQNNPAYLAVILLSRVIVRLGSLPAINPKIIENLFASDLAFLQDLYNRVNQWTPEAERVICPNCRHEFRPDGAGIGAGEGPGAGGSLATPSVN